MAEVVLDTSVILAVLLDESYDSSVRSVLEGAILSSVTLAEILTKAGEFDMHSSPALADLLSLMGRVEPFTEDQAWLAGELRASTKRAGLSLSDRCCLALGIALGADVYTADRAWRNVSTSCRIVFIR